MSSLTSCQDVLRTLRNENDTAQRIVLSQSQQLEKTQIENHTLRAQIERVRTDGEGIIARHNDLMNQYKAVQDKCDGLEALLAQERRKV